MPNLAASLAPAAGLAFAGAVLVAAPPAMLERPDLLEGANDLIAMPPSIRAQDRP